MRQRDDSWLVHGRTRHAVAFLFTLLPLASACTRNAKPTLVPTPGVPYQRGSASWYGPSFHGRRTANGERYDMHALTAAHPSLPFGTLLTVRNADNGREVVVRVNDRGPYSRGRILDVSYEAANRLGMVGPGTAIVELFPGLEDDVTLPRFTVQAGAFGDLTRAVTLHDQLAKIYPEAIVDSDGTWNRVQIGTFHERDQAERLRRELAVIGVSAVVVTAR
jgi:rare lipoprotein A